MNSSENENISVQNTEISFGKTVDVVTRKHGTVSRRVWKVSDGLIYVCTEHVFEDLQQGREAPLPIGFPYSAVSLKAPYEKA